MSGKIFCVNHQPVSLYLMKGWSAERLANYYNPNDVATKCLVAAYGEQKSFALSEKVGVIGFQSFFELEKLENDFLPDVIRCYECNQPFSTMALKLAVSSGIPSYLSLHDSRKVIEKELSAYTVITAYAKKLADKTSSILKRTVEVQRNGVDSLFFDPEKTEKILWSHQYDFVVYTTGRSDPVKNTKAVINAFSDCIKRTGIKACIIVSGAIIPDLKLPHVYCIGQVDQFIVRAILNSSDLSFMVEMVPELGVAATESIMMGIPVIHAEDDETKVLLKWPIGLTVPFTTDIRLLSDYLEYAFLNIEALKEASFLRRNFAVQMFDANILRNQESERYKSLMSKS